jgi:hypothetical protein
MERKRKMQRTGAQGSHKKFRDGSSSQGPFFHYEQQQRMQVSEEAGKADSSSRYKLAEPQPQYQQ